MDLSEFLLSFDQCKKNGRRWGGIFRAGRRSRLRGKRPIQCLQIFVEPCRRCFEGSKVGTRLEGSSKQKIQVTLKIFSVNDRVAKCRRIQRERVASLQIDEPAHFLRVACRYRTQFLTSQ